MTRYTQRPGTWPDLDKASSAFAEIMGCRPDRIRPLSGGFSNANYAVDETFVLRLYPIGKGSAVREAHILELASQAGVLVPKVVKTGDFQGRDLLILTLEPGRLLDQQADFADVGAQLARVHSLRFKEWGLFGEDGSLVPFQPGFAVSMIGEYLEGRAGQRLGRQRVEAVRDLGSASLHPRAPTLVHSDFNPKNILIGENGAVTAVLDWEFAMAADPLIDFGNFFRFPQDYNSRAEPGFVEGYRQAGGVLPPDWERQAQLHDLISLLDFLDKNEELPETFATALDRIDRILG